jgi:hypothetical protein
MRQQANKPTGSAVYEDFSLGDYGVVHPRSGKAGSFHGINVVVYRDGTLGPRNGLVQQPLAGAKYVDGALNMLYFGVEHEVATPRMVYGQGITPKFFEVEDMTSQNPQTFTGPSGTPDPFVFAADTPTNGKVAVLERLGFNMYWSPLGDNTYLVDALSDEVETLTGTNQSFGAHDIVEYLDRLYLIGIGDGASNRGYKVVYSDRDDPTSWPDENIFLVGYAWVLSHGNRMLNGLIMSTQDERWYLLQGTPTDGSLRNVASGRGPLLNSHGGMLIYKDRAWYLASGAPGGAYPCVFDGQDNDTETYKHLRGHLDGSDNIGGLVCETDGDMLFVDSEANALMFHEGAWTRHEYEVGVGEWCSSYDDQRFYLTVDGTVSTEPIFYRSTFAIEGPPIKDSLWQSPGDGSDTPVDAWVEFPEVWQEDGSTAKPITVTLEFTSYDQNVAATAHIACEVDVINRFGMESTETIDGGAWDESDASVASTADGIRRKHIFRLPVAHQGAALQLRFTDIRGVKIERAVLDYELGSQLDRA